MSITRRAAGLSVMGCHVRPFDSPVAVKRAPLIGENNE
jgi:hypothetical protein